MFLKWPFSKIVWSVNKHGLGEWGLLALYRHKKILKISSSLKWLFRFWNFSQNRSLSDLFQKLFATFWSVNKYGSCQWGLLALYRHEEILKKSSPETAGQILKWFHRNVPSVTLLKSYLWNSDLSINMVLVNGGFLHSLYRHKNILQNSSVKLPKKKLAMVLSEIHVSDPGPSWPSCYRTQASIHQPFSRTFFVFFSKLLWVESNLNMLNYFKLLLNLESLENKTKNILENGWWIWTWICFARLHLSYGDGHCRNIFIFSVFLAPLAKGQLAIVMACICLCVRQ